MSTGDPKKDAAAERRAAREKEIADQRARRGGAAAETPAPEATPASPAAAAATAVAPEAPAAPQAPVTAEERKAAREKEIADRRAHRGEHAWQDQETDQPDGARVPPESFPLHQPGSQIILRARAAAWNYTYGPAYCYRGPRSIDEIYAQGEPVVVVADNIPIDELRRLELTRVRGFVFEEGSATDEELYNFLMNEKRAAVLGCVGAMYFAEEGGWVIVDGVAGLVCFNPTPDTLERFQSVREKGPPPRERMDQMAETFKVMLDDAIKKREAAEHKPHVHMTPKEAVAAQKEAPGLILQLLAGLPIPGAPQSGDDHAAPAAGHDAHGDHAGHDHGEGRGHDAEAEAKRSARDERRAEAKRSRSASAEA